MQELDALNLCLQGVGLDPIGSNELEDYDTGSVQRALALAMSSVQSRGWWFNEDGYQQVAPDPATGIVAIPNDCLDLIVTSGSSEYTMKDRKLWDRYNYTFDISESVTGDTIELSYIRLVPFNHLPEPAKLAIAHKARRIFAEDEDGDANNVSFKARDEDASWHELHRQNRKHKRSNQIEHNPSNSYKLSKISAHRRSIGYSNFPKRNTR